MLVSLFSIVSCGAKVLDKLQGLAKWKGWYKMLYSLFVMYKGNKKISMSNWLYSSSHQNKTSLVSLAYMLHLRSAPQYEG